MNSMKNLSPAFLIFCFIALFGLANCQKEKQSDSIVDDLPQDSTQQGTTGHIVSILAQEMSTNLPIANRRIDLVTKTSTYYGTAYFFNDSLGRTDANGKLEWHWDGKELPANSYFSCSHDNAPKTETGKTPAKNIICWSMVNGSVKLHIKVKLDSLQYANATVVRFKFNYNGSMTWDDLWGFNPNKTKDTTVTLTDLGPATYSYGIRYNVNYATYSDYLYSGNSIQFPLSFYPRKTEEKEIVLE